MEKMEKDSTPPTDILSFSYSFSYPLKFYCGYFSAASIFSHYLISVIILLLLLHFNS